MNQSGLSIAIACSVVASTILALVLYVLYRAGEGRRALGHWALAYAFNTLRFSTQMFTAMGILASSDLATALVNDLSLLGFITFLWTGSRIYNGESLRRNEIAFFWVTLGAWMIFADTNEVGYPWHALPQYTLAGIVLLRVGFSFLRRYRLEVVPHARNLAYLAVGCFMAMRGLHILDYPFLRMLPAFAPVGFAIGAIIDYATGVTLLVAILGEERAQASRLAADLSLALERSSVAERELIDREMRLEHVLDLATNAITVTELESGRITQVNADFGRVFRRNPIEVREHTFDELQIYVEASMEKRLLDATEEAGGVLRGWNAQMRRQDGSIFPAELAAATFESEGRRFLLTAVRDASADHSLVQTQQRMREREEFFSLVFQLIPDTLTVVRESDERFVEVNRNWQSLLGYSREETLGKTPVELNVWAELEEREGMIAALREHSELHDVVLHMRHRKGHILPVRASLSVFETAGERFYLFAGNDITDILAAEDARREAEQRVKESEYKFATMFQLAPLPLALTNFVSGEIEDVNDAWLGGFGRSRDETVGRTLLQLNLLVDPDGLAALMETLDREGRAEAVEASVRVAHGRILECVASARVIVLDGQQMCIFSLVDFTDQRSAEREVRRLNVELEERVVARTRRLEEANFELGDALDSLRRTQDELIRSEKLAALGRLVAGVAHELNTPIGNGFIVSTTLQEQVAHIKTLVETSKLKRSDLDLFIDQVTSGSALLLRTLGTARDLIRNFKQVAVDQASSQRRTFDLREVLEEVAATLLPMYRKGPIKFVLEAPQGISMDSYPGPLGQVITNFTSNALAHAFEGLEEGVMRLSARQIDDYAVELRFADDGRGIDPEHRSRIFDPFFTTKLGRGGSGLGMPIVYNIVTSVLGGSVELETEVGVGTTFVVRIPLTAPETGIPAIT